MKRRKLKQIMQRDPDCRLDLLHAFLTRAAIKDVNWEDNLPLAPEGPVSVGFDGSVSVHPGDTEMETWIDIAYQYGKAANDTSPVVVSEEVSEPPIVTPAAPQKQGPMTKFLLNGSALMDPNFLPFQ